MKKENNLVLRGEHTISERGQRKWKPERRAPVKDHVVGTGVVSATT